METFEELSQTLKSFAPFASLNGISSQDRLHEVYTAYKKCTLAAEEIVNLRFENAEKLLAFLNEEKTQVTRFPAKALLKSENLSDELYEKSLSILSEYGQRATAGEGIMWGESFPGEF